MYRDGVLRASLEPVKRDYAEYCIVLNGRIEATREAGDDRLSLEELLGKELLCDKAADTEDVTDKRFRRRDD